MSARQWFPSGWVCSKSLQLSCVACLKLKIVVRLSQVVWGVTHPSLLCWGENVKHGGWEWFRDCRPQGRSLPGPSGTCLPGNSKHPVPGGPASMCNPMAHPPFRDSASRRGWIARPPANAHLDSFYSVKNWHSWDVALRRGSSTGNENNNASIAIAAVIIVIIPVANTLFSTDYRPTIFHKNDCLNHPIG